MSDVRMSLLAGTGRAVRHRDLVAFSAAPIAGLADMLAVDGTDVFKRLAALVVRHQFDLPAFAVIDTTAHRAFVFGDIALHGPGGSISGGQATTWVEATVADLELLACGPEGTQPDPDTDLVEGAVPAGGFVLSTDPAPSAAGLRPDAVPLSAATPAEDVEPEFALSPEPELALLAETVLMAEPERVLMAEPEPVGVSEPDLATADAPGRTTTYDEAPARLSILDQPVDWNPLADPVGVDLASLGRVNHPAGAPSGSGWTRPATAEPAPDAPPAPPAPPDAATIALRRPLGVPAGPEADIPPPPAGPVPPVPVPLTVDDDPGATLPEIPALMVTADPAEGPEAPARLRCDDGQLIEVRVGAYVGRHPTKGGLPEGYVAVTIRGEHVSRVHWKLTVAGDGLLIADLGSASGTSIQLPGWSQAAALEGTEPTVVLPGTTVHFADRWAVVEV